jgi:hypothetical protein
MRFHVFGLIAVLIFGVRSVEAQIPGSGSSSSCLGLVRKTYQLLGAISGKTFEHFEETFPFIPRADGGDGGGSDGSGGDGSGGDGSGGDGSDGDGTGDSGDGNGDGPSGDTGTVGNQGDPGSQGDQGDPGNQGDPANDVGATPNDAQAPADPAALAIPSDPSSVPDVATNDPALGLRGPGSPGSGDINNEPARIPPVFSGGTIPVAAVNVGINAVIISGAPTPREAVGKVPGVQNVVVTGGIIALGQTPLAKPPLGVVVGAADRPPAWLSFKPDFRYLNGSLFPPVVPNVIDIRTISYTEQAIENPSE